MDARGRLPAFVNTSAWEPLHIRLDSYGVIGHPVTPDEQRDLAQRWLERYCRNVKQQTGAWIHLGYRWHAYSYGYEAALEGDAARAAYLARPVTSFLVYFESDGLLFTCFGTASPLFGVAGRGRALRFRAGSARGASPRRQLRCGSTRRACPSHH